MKPLKLAFSAFGPYTKEVVLDFADLKGRAFFLIHGPTGAGKTTILDAMCFALYGDASGEKREAKMLRSNQADAASATEVDFTFAIGAAVYRVWRSPEQLRAKKRGTGTTLSPADALLYKIKGADEKLLVQGYAKVTEHLEQLLGFKSNQFRQVVLLPQGEFRQLLLANSAQRQEIMETLFKTEFYRLIEERLKAKARDIESAQAECMKKQQFILEEARAGSAEELAEQIEKQQQLAKELQSQAAALQQAQQAAQKKAADGKLLESRFKAAETARKEKQACEMLLPKVQAGRKAYELAEKAAVLLDREKQVRAFAAEDENNKRQLTAQQQAVAALQSREKQAQERWLCEQGKEEQRKAADACVLKLAGFTAQLAEWTAAQKQAVLQAQVAAGQAAAKAAAEKQLGDLRQQLQAAQAKQQTLREQAQGEAGWQAECEKKERERELYLAAAKLLQEEQAACLLCEEKKAAAAAAEEHYRRLATEQERLQHLFMEGQAAILAGGLQRGKPCPVCGSACHPQPALSQAMLPSEAEVRRAQAAAKQAEVKRQAAHGDYQQAQAGWESLVKQGEMQQAALRGLAPLAEILAAKEKAVSQYQAAQKAGALLAALQEEIDQFQIQEKKQAEELTRLTAAAQQSHGAWQAALAVEQERAGALPPKYRENGLLEQAQRAAAQQQKQLYEAFAIAEGELQQVRQLLAAALAASAAAEKQAAQGNMRYQEAAADFRQRREKAGFATAAEYERAAAWSEAKRSELQEHLRAFDDRFAAANELAAKSEAEIAGQLCPDTIELNKILAQASADYNEAYAEWQKMENEILRSQNKSKQMEELLRKAAAVDREYRNIGTLAAVAGGKNAHGITFQRFVLKSLLLDVIDASNMRLKIMSRGQYRLQATDERARKNAAGGLEMEVFDEYTGYARPIATLSGGETFLASLCLALGLADVVQSYAGGIHLDTILVDEGFGTLDPEALDTALRALLELQKGGRLVGIISHVPELKERIDARLEVTKDRQGSTAKFYVG